MNPFKLNYQKVRIPNLETMAQQWSEQEDNDQTLYDYNPFRISGLQSYNPLYNLFFNMDSTNCQKITLNHKNIVTSLETVSEGTKAQDGTKTSECDNKSQNAKIFVKSSPLLDPLHFLRGKYDLENPLIRQLPTLDSTKDTCFPKILDANNSAYVDGFFSYLTSMMHENHGWIHGVQYYGSFLGIQSRFRYNVADDIDFLEDSEYFSKNISKYFDLDDEAFALFNQKSGPGSRRNRDKLNIVEDETIDLGIEDLDDTVVSTHDTVVSSTVVSTHDTTVSSSNDTNVSSTNIETQVVNGDTVKSCSNNLEDIVVETEYVAETRERAPSDSSDDSSISNSTVSDDDNVANKCDECGCEVVSTKYLTEVDGKSYCGGCDPSSKGEDDDSSDYTDYSGDDEDEKMFAYLHDFPVQLIFQERCEGTFDELLVSRALSPKQTFAALFQILIVLATYQKMFSFTHNDLHTNNIMWIKTDLEHIQYLFEGQYYRVPTFGRIFKLIDFGRAIYQFNGRRFCSDSFSENGDANSQYNCEPYYNPKKPVIDPNPSFDVSRLGCSLYDFTMESDSTELKNLIDEWCEDDYGKNILYKSSGEERYPGFKLYKMIARIVNNLVPKDILKKSVFAKYRVAKAQKGMLINIDEMPVYINNSA
jgi:hypothetical protein